MILSKIGTEGMSFIKVIYVKPIAHSSPKIMNITMFPLSIQPFNSTFTVNFSQCKQAGKKKMLDWKSKTVLISK